MTPALSGGSAAISNPRPEKTFSPSEFAFEFEKLTTFAISERWVQAACQRGRIKTVFESYGRHLIPVSELPRLVAEMFKKTEATE